MTAPHIVDPERLLGEALAEASPDLMRSLLQTMINALLSADADTVVAAEYGRPTPGRTGPAVNHAPETNSTPRTSRVTASTTASVDHG
jgi:transposase-like protein